MNNSNQLDCVIELAVDLFYDMDNGELYKYKNRKYKYVIYDRKGYKQIYYHGGKRLSHLLIHQKLGIDLTGFVVAFLDGNKKNTSAKNMAVLTRHECNQHHYWLRRKAKKTSSPCQPAKP